MAQIRKGKYEKKSKKRFWKDETKTKRWNGKNETIKKFRNEKDLKRIWRCKQKTRLIL